MSIINEDTIKRFKEEIDIYISSLNSVTGNKTIEQSNAEHAYTILENIYNKEKTFTGDLLDLIYKFINTGLLTPLTLKDDEFEQEEYDEDGVAISKINKRCDYIKLDYLANNDIRIRNTNAWEPIVNKIYDHNTLSEITDEVKNGRHIPLPCKGELYLTKGGCITGDFIDECYIKETTNYIPPKPIELPVSIIVHGAKSYYVIDNRNPKIAELKSKYYVYVYHNGFMQGKYDIKKYKKLK